MKKIERLAKLLRDIGFIIGMPIVLIVGGNLYSTQIAVLKEQNELLKQTQYDKAFSMLDAQKKLANNELKLVVESLDTLEKLIDIADECTEHLKDSDPSTTCSRDDYGIYANDVVDKMTELKELINRKK